jgi:hypothetical protein
MYKYDDSIMEPVLFEMAGRTKGAKGMLSQG